MRVLKHYFKKYWMNTVRPEIFSIHGVNFRTNNSCEGFQNRFARFLRKRKPNLWIFLKKIIQENSNVEIKLSQMEAGNLSKKSKNSKFINFNNSLQKKYADLEDGLLTTKEFLFSVDLLLRK